MFPLKVLFKIVYINFFTVLKHLFIDFLSIIVCVVYIYSTVCKTKARTCGDS